MKLVADKLRKDTGSAEQRSILIAGADFSGKKVVHLLVGGRCNETAPELHAYTFYTVDLTTDEVSVSFPS